MPTLEPAKFAARDGTSTFPIVQKEREPSNDVLYTLQKTFLLNIMKGQMLLVLQENHVKDNCNVYPYVSGEFTPVESYSKRE